jgi:hypothetical protein
MLRVCTRCQQVSRDLIQSPAVACREIEPPSSSAVPVAEKPFSPCRHWSTGRANSASRASSSPSKRIPAIFWQTPQASGGASLTKLEKKQLFFFDAKMGPDVIKAGEFDLSGMLAGIKAEADASGARRIVFDAVDALLMREEELRAKALRKSRAVSGSPCFSGGVFLAGQICHCLWRAPGWNLC